MVFLLLLLTTSFFEPFVGDAAGVATAQASASCQCVASHLCGDNDAAVNGQGLLDIRIHPKKCTNYFEVCCENVLSEENLPNQYPIYRGCGYRNRLEVTPRITSDSKEVSFAEMPWTILVLVRDVDKTERNMYKCGGSLIHPRVVLTAAHCIYDVKPSLITVRAGEWNTKSQEEPLPHQDRIIKDILIHPQFHSGSLKNDVGLAFLTDPFVLVANVGLICLPPPLFQLEEATCTAAGWGKENLENGKHSTVLKKVDLPLVPREKCIRALRNTRLGNFYKLHNSFICAGGESNKDTCKGDGGSPLVCPIPGHREGRFFQMGIVSWGIGCGDDEVPGVYVNAPLFSKWIDDELSAKGLETSYYKY